MTVRFFIWGNYNNWAINIENWCWYIEWTPAFIGSGLLVGLNVGISYFLGSVLAWGVIGPLTIRYGVCKGRAMNPEDERWGDMVSFLSLSGMDQPGNIPSPRYWLLWPGVMIMICYSFAEMLSHWRVIWIGMLYIWSNLKVAGRTMKVSWEKSLNSHRGQAIMFPVASVEGEPGYSETEEQTSAWIWGTGCLMVLILSCVIFEVQFGISWGESF